jgi:hypothetical protein
MAPSLASTFPTPIDAYPPAADTLWDTLASRLQVDPFNVGGAVVPLGLLAGAIPPTAIAVLALRLI